VESNTAVKVENVSKQYRLGREVAGVTLGESVTRAVSRSFHAIPGKIWRAAFDQNIPAKQDFLALHDVSFEVRAGEVLGILGPNGAGKSTLLKLLSRITEPTQGRITVGGSVSSLLEVGTGFHPELTGRENIFLNGAILGMTRREIQTRFEEIVTFAGVERFLDTAVKYYSSGMYVRLAFAVAAHLEPDILVIDEVLAVGDAEFQRKCLGKLEDVARHGRTVLFVSHNMNAIERLCSSALLLRNGQVAEHGSDVEAIVSGYLSKGVTPGGPAAWTNHGNQFDNEWFRPMQFNLVDQNERILSRDANASEEMWINIQAEVRSTAADLTIGYAIYTEDDVLLYWSYQTDVREELWPSLEMGLITLRSPFPTHLLNEGNYRLELIGGLHYKQWLFEPRVNAPSIHITIRGGLSESPYWIARRAGLLAPVIQWTVSRDRDISED
jgi:lipopolysaccharide transport system ATP-binding protein